MKKIFLLVTALAVSFVLHAQDRAIIQPPRPKVGVVLGGGGAKGAAHIGALKYIEEMGIPIDYVAGTSMGSIIGGLYAMGYTPDELTVLIANMDWSQYIGNRIDRPMMSDEAKRRSSTLLVNVPFSLEILFDKNSNSNFISQLPSAYVNNSSLVNLFNDLCVGYQEEMDFNNMPIPFACVATDLITGNEVVLRSGSVPTAMRASMAIPGVFSPVQMGDKLLVDGGLVNNFPADVLRTMGADIIIGIEITSTKDVTADDLQSLPQLFGRLVTNSTNGKREENREMCNIYIVPDVSGYGMLSFSPTAIDTLVGRGYKKASEFHDQLQSIKTALETATGHPVGKVLHAPHAKNIDVDSVRVRSITINNVSNTQSRWLIRKGKLKVDKMYTRNVIHKSMQIFRGTGCFDEITYQVKESDSLHQDRATLDGYYDLVVDVKPAKPHVVGLGVRYDTEEGAALLLNIGLNAKKFGGSKFDASVKLSYNPKINLTYTYSRAGLANFNLAFDYRNEHFGLMNPNQKIINLHYKQQKYSGYISQFHLLNIRTMVGLSYTSTTFGMTSYGEETILDSLFFAHNRLLSPFVSFEYDNLDHSYFAKHGLYCQVTGRYVVEPKNRTTSFIDAVYAFQYYITPFNGRITIIPQIYGSSLFNLHNDLYSDYFNTWNLYGGEIAGRHFEKQLPFIGFNHVEFLYDHATIFRCDLRYNFYGKHYLTAIYNIACEWDVPEIAASGAGLKYSYNSLLGPISLTGQWSTVTKRFGLYFSFGYTF